VRRVAATLDHGQAALAAARSAGLAVEGAEVARVASNVLVRLEPGPSAARLTGATEGLRDCAANLRREARLAAALAAVGAPVPAPLGGPYDAGGRTVTLWPWLELCGEGGDAEQAGRALRACHDALADLDPAGLELEPLAMLTEARRLAAGALAAHGGPSTRACWRSASTRAWRRARRTWRRRVAVTPRRCIDIWTGCGEAPRRAPARPGASRKPRTRRPP
jgi:hypothetical protein